jgi:hypothetical protein
MISFFDLLGIDRGGPQPRREIAAELWPSEEIQPFTGDAFGDTEDYRELMDFLEGCLEFRAIRSGAADGTVGLSAEVHVTSAATLAPQPLVLAKMPDVAFHLQPTQGLPAQLYVTQGSDGGVQVVIQGLPVEIRLPAGFIRPQRTKEQVDANDLPDVETTAAPFDVTDPDALRIVLRDFDPSSIFVRIDVRMTAEFDFAIDTHLPITIGPCAFLDLPCEALHDLQLIPSPRLQHAGELPVEWARHNLDTGQLSAAVPGLYAFRAIDLDRKQQPLAELIKRYATSRPAPKPGEPPEQNDVEPIIEDVAFPAFTSPLPIPVHLRLGLRRVVVDRDAPFGEEYALDTAPVEIPLRDWRLKIFRFLLQTTNQPQAAGEIEAVLVAGSDPQTNWSFGIDYSDEGVLIATAIIPVEDRVRLFKILNRTVSVVGLKLGYSLFEPDPRHVKERPAVVLPAGDLGWADRFILLADLEVAKVPDDNPFAIETKGGADKPSLLHDLGWYLGGLSIGAFYDPDGLKITVFDRFRLEIEEIAVVTATNGASYFMVSAGIDLGIGEAKKKSDPPKPGDAPPAAGGQEAAERGGGVHVFRLKLRLSEDDHASPVLLDGISLSLKTTSLELEGFGMISDFFVGGTRLREFGFAIRARFEALKKRFDLGVGFFYGSASGAENFTYWMFNLVLGVLPLGSAEARNLRVLVAGNMRPRLAPPDGNPEPLRLFRWYKSDGDALTLPLNRKLTSWERHDDSFAFGAGARFHLAGTKAVSLDIFFFVHSSPEEKGLFAALECYLAKGDKPIAWGVLEIDFEHASWAAQIGVALGLDNVLGKPNLPDALKRLGALTGTVFLAKNIDTIALGQYADPATWLTARFKWPHGWQAEIWAALCIHHVDTPEGPRVLALSTGAKGSIDIAIGKLKLYATLTLAIGRWRNEAVASGVVVRIEAGVRIRVFRVINFGAVIEVELDWLGPPAYSRQSFTFKIETPWWLPDVSVRFEHHSGTPRLSQMQMASTPLVGASALPPATRAAEPIGATPLLGSGEAAVFSLDQLRTSGPAAVTDAAFDALRPVPTDSRIMLDFKPSLEAPVTLVPDTPADVGVQRSGETSARYELVEIGVRRRRRFGPGAGVWADLVTPETTRIDTAADLTAVFNSAVRFEWDMDVHREGRTDTRRLLVNADTGYSFGTYDPAGDDVAATTFPGWPCCHNGRQPPRWHEVSFESIPLGVRVPAIQRFTDSRSTLTWQGGLPPVVAAPDDAPAGSVPAFIGLAQRVPGPIAVASFDTRIAICEIDAYWGAEHSHNQLVIDAFDGLALVASQTVDLATPPPPVIRFTVPTGITSLLMRKLGEIAGKGGEVELVRVRYRAVREELLDAIHDAKCQANDDRVHGAGILAWLPNRDYEITARVRVTLDHERSGAQTAEIEQKAYFRTKGLPGLNAVARVGDEIEPYVESRYPGPGTARLYRLEPLAVAFTERFNILVPVARTTSPAEEANQILEWVLAVEKVGGVTGFERVTKTAEDWVVMHRGMPLPPPRRRPRVLTAAIFTAGERTAPSLDPQVVRYEAMMDRPGGCLDPGDGLHRSQVLVHAPVDPGAPDHAVPRWEPDEELRVNLRQKDAPFIERAPFDEPDASAFTTIAESGPGVPWRSDGGVMRPDADPLPTAAQYAVFGESDWRHVQVGVAVDPTGGEAGVAVTVAGSHSIEALLSAAGQLRLIERNGPSVRTLAGPVAAPVGTGTVPLDVVLYDDRVLATVGAVSIDGALGAVREGRLALVARGGGRFTRLEVGGLDAWCCHARTSRYDDFPAHINSFTGAPGALRPGDLGTPTATVADLVDATAADIAAAMTPRSDAESRQRLFETWATSLGLPLREHPAGLSLTRWVENDATTLLLLESDEPVPFSQDVTLTLTKPVRVHAVPPSLVAGRLPPRIPPGLEAFLNGLEIDDDAITGPPLPARLAATRRILRAVARETADVFVVDRSISDHLLARRARQQVPWPPALGIPQRGDLAFLDEQNTPVIPPFSPTGHIEWTPVATLLLTGADETRALIAPSEPLPAGSYRLTFAIDRARWRAAVTDSVSNYRASSTLDLTWN